MAELRGWLRKRIEDVAQERHEFSNEIKRFRIGETRKIIVFPEHADEKEVNITYPLLPPFAYARIKWSDGDKALVYYIDQPGLTDEERAITKKIEEGLNKTLGINVEKLETANAQLGYLQEKVLQILEEYGQVLKPGQYTRIMYYIYINFVGLNKIEPLLHDSYIEDISCDGLIVPIFITHKKYGNLKTNINYTDAEELQDFVVKLAEKSGRYISYAEPMLDGTLPDGSRVNATLAKDITTRGPTFTIRKFRDIPYSAVDLMSMGTASGEIMAYLWYIIEHKKNLLVVGGTGAGKTSFLNSIVSFIPPEDKIISIEDTRELNLQHENWLPAVARIGFGSVSAGDTKYGEVSLFDLLKESFRQHPDYVIVGEVRGAEASVLFQGMASGHPSMGTVHGGSVEDIIKRMETPPISLPPSLLESLDVAIVVTHASAEGKSARRVKRISEIREIDPNNGLPKTIDAFGWSPVQDRFDKNRSYVLEEISIEYGKQLHEIEHEIEIRTKVLQWLLEHRITSFAEVATYLSEYYKNRSKVLREMQISDAVAVPETN